MLKILEFGKSVRPLVDDFLFKLLEGKPKKLYVAASHLPKAGGKRLRPILLLAITKGVGGDWKKAIPAAAAIELLHNFTLVHDDIMDEDEFRRGVPTVHKLWGEDTAILAGDLLFAKVFEAASKLVDYGVDHAKVVKIVDILSWASITVAEGQVLDIEFENREEVSEEEYIEMITKKTGALFKASAEIGAIIGGAPSECIAKLGEYGLNLGIAFQIRDDILGLTADEKTLGKPIYSDIREGKKTILVIHALKKLSPEEKKTLLNILGKSEDINELKKAADLIIKSNALEYAEKLAEKYVKIALEKLEEACIQDREVYDMLKELALYIIKREK